MRLSTATIREPGVAFPPAADFITDTWLQNESRAAVVGLSEGRSDLLRRTLDPLTDGDKTCVLATDERSVLTPVLHDALRAAGATWAVREDSGTLRDGFTGRHATRIADLVADPAEPHPAPQPLAEDDISPIFLRRIPDHLPEHASAHLRQAFDFPLTRQIHVSLSVHRHARETTVVGLAAQTAIEQILGTTLTSWGTHEPALAPWDPQALTAYAREHVANSPRLVVVGEGAVGTVTARRTAEGIEETTQLWLRGGEPGAAETNATLDRVAGALAAVSRQAIVGSGLAVTRTGRADLNVPAHIQAPGVPLAMIVGAAAMNEAGVTVDDGVSRFAGLPAGSRRVPALVLPLGTPEHADWGRMTEVLRWLGPAAYRIR